MEDTAMWEETVSVPTDGILKEEIENLDPATDYEVEIRDADNPERVIARGRFTTESSIPHTGRKHVVDGDFTGTWEPWLPEKDINHEWQDVKPVRGEYTFTYLDYDGDTLYVMNDWWKCSQESSDAEDEQFALTISAQISQLPECGIKKVGSYVDGKFEQRITGAKYGFGSSPKVPHQQHTRFELAIPVIEVPEQAIADSFHIELAGPFSPGGAPLKDPVSPRVRLRRGGGLMVCGDYKSDVMLDGHLLKIHAEKNSAKVTLSGSLPARVIITHKKVRYRDDEETTHRIEALKKEMTREVNQLEAKVERQNTALEGKVDALKEEISELKETVTGQQNQIETLEVQISEIKEDLDRVVKMVERLVAKESQSEDPISERVCQEFEKHLKVELIRRDEDGCTLSNRLSSEAANQRNQIVKKEADQEQFMLHQMLTQEPTKVNV